MNIPFNKITFDHHEEQAILDTVRSGWVVQGPKVKEFEEKFADYVGSKYAVMVNSGTSALDLSIKYWKSKDILSHKSPLIVPSLTFTATAEVVVHNGLSLVFRDVGDDLLIDTGELGNEWLRPDVINTHRMIPVHLCGNKKEGDFLIEDSAHMILPNQCKDSKGLVCFSFYATKNISTIQGGMIATNNESAYKWLLKARDHGVTKGTNERYKDGKWAYDIDFVGYRYKSDDVTASIGIEQLKKIDWINENRQRVIDKYNKGLNISNKGLHLYPVLVSDRNKFIDYMKEKGIQCSVHFLPLHKMTAYKETEIVGDISLPKTEYFGERLVSLPLFPQMTDEEIQYVIDCANETGLIIK